MTNDPLEETVPYLLNELYFYLTDACNLACRHCWLEPRYCPEEKAISVIDPALFTAILDQAEPLGMKGVKLTGGEPLLHPQID
ncbi:MAG: 4Fe-4S cluster-binding domain-containing protein, partial [Deltaproteobacteria bacterium]|nr:4Fe-4S cluster-binding domain-containing protein [Deltaproteobacteria bacterium]